MNQTQSLNHIRWKYLQDYIIIIISFALTGKRFFKSKLFSFSKTSWRRLEDILKTSWRHLEEVLEDEKLLRLRLLEDSLKRHVLKKFSKRLGDQQMFAGKELGATDIPISIPKENLDFVSNSCYLINLSFMEEVFPVNLKTSLENRFWNKFLSPSLNL